MKRFFALLILASTALISTNVQAIDLKGIQPLAPYGIFSAFSAETLRRGNAGLALGIEKSEEPDYWRFTAQFAYGISDSLEFDITVPYVADWNHSTSGFEDIAVGLKYRFFDEGRYGPSIAGIITGSLYTGRDEFTSEGSIGGGIIISKRIGPVIGHANILYVRPGTGSLKDDITFSAGLDFSAAHNLKILAELYANKSYSGSLEELELRFGYRIVTAENFFTTFGVGFDLKNRSPEYRLLVSLSYILTPEKRKIRQIDVEE